jgi:alpha-L-fucosidase 2
MLLQSHRGDVHLLPALPSSWVTGSVSGLRARGGYTVDVRWRDGRLESAVIRADRGGKVRVRYGESAAEYQVTAGRPVTLSAGPSGLVIR